MSGMVALAELLEHGLSRQPACACGIGFRACATVLCRAHVDGATLERLGVVDERAPDDGAVLLIGGPETERALRAWWVACRPEERRGRRP